MESKIHKWNIGDQTYRAHMWREQTYLYKVGGGRKRPIVKGSSVVVYSVQAVACMVYSMPCKMSRLCTFRILAELCKILFCKPANLRDMEAAGSLHQLHTNMFLHWYKYRTREYISQFSF
jgi:hypothetical protein